MTRTFISVVDLAAFKNVHVDDNLHTIIAIDAACQTILDYTGDITLHLADEILLDGEGIDAVVLPAAPVWRINSVLVDDVAMYSPDWRFTRSGVLYRTGFSRWPEGRARLRVNYDHGYATNQEELGAGSGSGGSASSIGVEPMPDSIREAALEIANEVLGASAVAAGGITSETIGDYSYAKGVADAAMNDRIRSALRTYRVRGGYPVYQT